MPNIPSAKQRPSLQSYDIQPETLLLVSEEMARRYNVIPLEVRGNVLHVAMAKPG